MFASPAHGPLRLPLHHNPEEDIMPDESQRMRTGQRGDLWRYQELTNLEHATDLLAQVGESNDYEQGTAFAVKSLAHSLLHIARGGPSVEVARMSQLAETWEKRADEPQAAGESSAERATRRCASELMRALIEGAS